MTAGLPAPRPPRDAVVGLIVNPVAGLGGAAGLKGSDGARIQREALARGATPRAGERAARAVRALLARRPGTRVVTVPGPMGEDSARAAGASFTLVRPAPAPADAGTPETDLPAGIGTPGADLPAGAGTPGADLPAGVATTARDTRLAVGALADVDLLLFAGGDGTARDVLDAVGALGDQAPPVLGIPAGVKVYSGCFAVSPAAAGLLAADHLSAAEAGLRRGAGTAVPADPDPAQSDPATPGPATPGPATPGPATPGPDVPGTVEAEVVDLDEERYRQGQVSPRLYGILRVPAARAGLSGRKAGSSGIGPATVEGIAREVVARMRPGVRYVLGPGATTQAVGRALGLATTLLGVDVVESGETGVLVAGDVAEPELLALVAGREAVVVLSVIGGQGFVLGRGNQQISPRVLDAVIGYGDAAARRLLVVSTPQKLAALRGRPLLADSGDEDLDRKLSGHVQVITGYRESTIYQICTASEEFHG
ncbi:NAD(+)/NADH kinase [Nonomuraea sp. NPDC003804]|uniref:ATP-NAD kinase family protein n=1 Tax=Nonomuraea sp. NPDC003804 TaxID=3154547 RepID=UPI0033BF217F